MKDLIISNSLNLIKKNDPDITDEKIEIIPSETFSGYDKMEKISKGDKIM